MMMPGPAFAGMTAGAAGTTGNDPAASMDDDEVTAAGDGGALPPPAGGFPKTDEVNVEQKGPYAFDSYTDGVEDPAYGSAIMYYPTDATPPFAAAVFSPGFTATKEQYMSFLGELLASHGIAMLLTTPTTTGDLPTQRAADLEAAVAVIARENTRDGSPSTVSFLPCSLR